MLGTRGGPKSFVEDIFQSGYEVASQMLDHGENIVLKFPGRTVRLQSDGVELGRRHTRPHSSLSHKMSSAVSCRHMGGQ